MARVFEREEERAAPMVPEERANAARGVRLVRTRLRWDLKAGENIQDVFRPRFGPDSYIRL